MTIKTVNVEELLGETTWLRSLARGLVGADDADDVAQETMLSALRSPPRSDQPLRPWLARVATNVARMRFRRESRQKRRDDAFGDHLADATQTHADVMKRFEMHQSVAQLLVNLDEPFRSTLLYRYFEDKTSAEIAAAQNVAEGTVRWRLKRGLELLRASLDEKTGDRQTWLMALQPLCGMPQANASTTVSAASSSAWVAKAAVVGLAVVAVSYGTYHLASNSDSAHSSSELATQSESAEPSQKSSSAVSTTSHPEPLPSVRVIAPDEAEAESPFARLIRKDVPDADIDRNGTVSEQEILILRDEQEDTLTTEILAHWQDKSIYALTCAFLETDEDGEILEGFTPYNLPGIRAMYEDELKNGLGMTAEQWVASQVATAQKNRICRELHAGYADNVRILPLNRKQ